MDPTNRDRPTPPAASTAGSGRGRSTLIYCGLCGALNPASNHFCAACGTTLVDAFHATEGLRVFERPDSASRLVEIVPAGSELDIVEDPDAPEDFVRVRLAHGRLGYIRLQEVEVLASAPGQASGFGAPDINTNARGCVTPTAALASLVLLIVTATLGLFLILRSESSDSGILASIFCLAVAPFMALTIGFYLYARSRDERLEEEEDEANVPDLASPRTADRPAEPA